jgi:protein SCO1/2
MTEEMARLQTYIVNRALPVRLVSVSVDPERDTPAKLSQYATRFHARPAVWTFLTGPTAEVQDAVVNGFRQTMTREADPVQRDGFAILHGTRFVLVDGKRQIRGYYDPADGEAMAALRRDLSALVEHGGS